MVLTSYLKARTRISIAVIASIFIIFYNRPLDLVDALTSGKFYLIFAISTFFALLMISIIHYSTIWLDRHITWEENVGIRSILQATLGLIVPALIDLFFFKIYFDSIGQNIFENGFFSIDFPAICILLLCFNILYVLLFYRAQTVVLKNEKENNVNLNLDYRSKEYVFDLQKDVLYFASINKQVRAYIRSGESYPVNETLVNLAQKYKDYGFMQINRTIVTNLDIIKEFQNGEKRHTLELIFKEGIKIDNQNLILFIVTRDNITAFKERFAH